MKNQQRKRKLSIEKIPCQFAFKISFPVRYFDSFLIFRTASSKRFFSFLKKCVHMFSFSQPWYMLVKSLLRPWCNGSLEIIRCPVSSYLCRRICTVAKSAYLLCYVRMSASISVVPLKGIAWNRKLETSVKICRKKIQIWLISDKNVGHFT